MVIEGKSTLVHRGPKWKKNEWKWEREREREKGFQATQKALSWWVSQTRREREREGEWRGEERRAEEEGRGDVCSVCLLSHRMDRESRGGRRSGMMDSRGVLLSVKEWVMNRWKGGRKENGRNCLSCQRRGREAAEVCLMVWAEFWNTRTHTPLTGHSESVHTPSDNYTHTRHEGKMNLNGFSVRLQHNKMCCSFTLKTFQFIFPSSIYTQFSHRVLSYKLSLKLIETEKLQYLINISTQNLYSVSSWSTFGRDYNQSSWVWCDTCTPGFGDSSLQIHSSSDRLDGGRWWTAIFRSIQRWAAS